MDAQALGFVLNTSPRRQYDFAHSLDEIHMPSHREALSLLETWKAAIERGGFVIGRHFPSRKFAQLLPNVLLLERVERARDFRIRLAGFTMLCYYGVELRKRRLSEFFEGAEHENLYKLFDGILHSGRPNLAKSQLDKGRSSVLQREIVSLPVLASDGRSPQVLVASFWNDKHWLN